VWFSWRPDVPVAAFGVAAVAGAYQALSLYASVRHWMSPDPPEPPVLPPVSILKPVRGVDPGFREAIQSHAEQDYPEFEILFGVRSLDDPAVPEIRKLMAAFPRVPIRLIECNTVMPNAKAGTLADLTLAARHEVLLVNDSDILVPARYLRRVVSTLAQPEIGLVTCIYAAAARSLPGWWEALGICTDFAPSILVARVLGVREFGMGSTLCFRREDLERIGGFNAIGDYLADDFQLAKRISQAGRRSVVARIPVVTHVNDDTWRGVWSHQVRWARTIRVSKGGGYLGLPVTHAGLWALLLALAGHWSLGAVLYAIRILAGVAPAVLVLGQRNMVAAAPLIPLWDLWAFAVWVTGVAGSTVVWRGKRIRLLRDGRLGEDCGS
jgi:ceramide glucosyltransferase